MLRFDFEGGEDQALAAYKIEFARKATDEIESTVSWYRERSARFAEKWYKNLVTSIYALITQPASHPISREFKSSKFVIRRMLYRQNHTAYHVYYAVIDPTQSSPHGIIRIIRVRNAVMRPLRQAQVEESQEPDEL